MKSEHHRIPESVLAEIWKGQWIQKGPLPSSDGRMVQVRYQGIENKDSGPDFLGASILLDDEIVTGDVELHVRSSDWYSHGHQHNPEYNSVILQVVLWADSKTPAHRENGSAIPTVSLLNFLNGTMDELSVRAELKEAPSLPCRGVGDRYGLDHLNNLLDQLGMERFYVKSASFEVSLILEDPEQVLYQGIMGALGYTKNKKAFQELARLLPLQIIRDSVLEIEKHDRVSVLQALLLGAAGLLPSQHPQVRNPNHLKTLSSLDNIWQNLGTNRSMEYTDWHFSRMHPKNFPTSRLMAAACLIDRHMDDNLAHSVINGIREVVPQKAAASIESQFIVRDLIGQARAREIAVNIVLPFSLAWSYQNSQSDLTKHILELCRAYPKSGDNQITRYLGKLFWEERKSAAGLRTQQQQGMIHLYKSFCQDQRCYSCPLVHL